MEIVVDSRSIDNISFNVLGLWHFSDERPLKGLTGLIDWNLDALISRLIISGKINGSWGEKVLLGSLNAFPDKQIILIGLGRFSECSQERIENAAGLMAYTAMRLNTESICIPLPGDGVADIDYTVQAEHILYGMATEIGNMQFRPVVVCDASNIEEVLLGFQATKVKLKRHYQISIKRVDV